MIRLLFLCLVIAGGVWLGLGLREEQGMVMVAVGGKSYEMSLFVAGVILFFGFSLIYLAIRMLLGFVSIPSITQKLQNSHRAKRSQLKTQQGLVELASGQFTQAEKLLLQGVKGAELPLVNYLAAARAANEQGLEHKRDQYLALAHDLTSDKDMAVGLTQAQLQLNYGQLEQSLATLKHMRSLSPKHPYVLKLLKTLYVQLRDWPQLLELLPTLTKQKIVEEAEAHLLEHQAYLELLSACNGDIHQMKTYWQQMPKHLQCSPDLIKLYAEPLILDNQRVEAEALIKYGLKKQWDEELAGLYGHFKPANPTKALSTAEGWLKSHPESPALLLTCGRLAAQNELWGKAQRYLEACLNIDQNIEAYAVLGLIYEKMDKPALSAECFRKGMIETASHQKALSDHLIEHKPTQSSQDNVE